MSEDLLIDTQIALWLVRGDERAMTVLGGAVEDPSSTLTMSVASMIEIAIKHSIGQLRETCDEVRAALLQSGILELQVTSNHASALENLPFHHRDPFDRLLIAQAQAEDMTFVTADRALVSYRDVVTLRGV